MEKLWTLRKLRLTALTNRTVYWTIIGQSKECGLSVSEYLHWLLMATAYQDEMLTLPDRVERIANDLPAWHRDAWRKAVDKALEQQPKQDIPW